MASKEYIINKHQQDIFETGLGTYYLMIGLDNLSTDNIQTIANTLSETKDEQLKQELVDIMAWIISNYEKGTIVNTYLNSLLGEGGNVKFAREWNERIIIYNSRIMDEQIKQGLGDKSLFQYIRNSDIQQLETSIKEIKRMNEKYKKVTGKEFYVAFTRIKDNNGNYIKQQYEEDSSDVLKEITDQYKGLEIYEIGEEFVWWKTAIETGQSHIHSIDKTTYFKLGIPFITLEEIAESNIHYTLDDILHYYDENKHRLTDEDIRKYFTHIIGGIEGTLFIVERNLLFKYW